MICGVSYFVLAQDLQTFAALDSALSTVPVVWHLIRLTKFFALIGFFLVVLRAAK
jgi:hypothetical protein